MSTLQSFVEFISEPVDNEPLNETLLLSNLIVSSIGLLITSIIFIIIFIQWYQNSNIREQIVPILIIGFALFLRTTVNFLTRVIIYVSQNQRELILINVFSVIPWILVYMGIIPIFKNIIKVPKRREYQVKRIIRAIYFTIFGLMLLAIIGFIPRGDRISGLIAVLGLLFTTIVLWVLVARIWRESRQNASKLVVIRLQMLALGNLMIAISFSTTPFLIFLAIMGQFGETLMFVNNLLTIAFTVIAQYFFYGTFFTPKWIKKRHGLVSPQSALI